MTLTYVQLAAQLALTQEQLERAKASEADWAKAWHTTKEELWQAQLQNRKLRLKLLKMTQMVKRLRAK